MIILSCLLDRDVACIYSFMLGPSAPLTLHLIVATTFLEQKHPICFSDG